MTRPTIFADINPKTRTPTCELWVLDEDDLDRLQWDSYPSLTRFIMQRWSSLTDRCQENIRIDDYLKQGTSCYNVAKSNLYDVSLDPVRVYDPSQWPSWYGRKYSPESVASILEMRASPHFAIYEKARAAADEALRLDLPSLLPKKVTKVTDRPIGTFNFARAATTLHSYPCYVPVNDMEAECYDRGLISRVDGVLRDTSSGTEVVAHPERRETAQGRTIMRSMTRKVYDIRQDVQRITPMVHLYWNSSYVSTAHATKNIIWSTITTMILADLLVAQGYRVAITLVQMSFCPVETKHVMASYVPVVKFGEPLDLNAVLLAGDASTFRYHGFIEYIRLCALGDSPCDSIIGRPMENDTYVRISDGLGISSDDEANVYISKVMSQQNCIDTVRGACNYLRTLFGSD
jgi:hypothetical protein